MDYRSLLDVTTELGYLLAMSGAETFRVEETITRIFAAYDIKAEAFAIPNCLTVSLETDEQQPMTRMRRIGHHGTDLDSVERYNALSRRICTEKPEPAVAMDWVKKAASSVRKFPFRISIIGSIIGASGFILVYGGSFTDGICAIICGLMAGLISQLLANWRVNAFFSTIASSFAIAFCAYLYGILGFAHSVDGIIISSLMLLVPGLLFTNALRDIIYGDTNSGINRIVQVLLIGVAIALGTGGAWNILLPFGSDLITSTPVTHSILLESLTTIVACMGFCILLNIHGKGGWLCGLGGGLTWAFFRVVQLFGAELYAAYFFATLLAAVYAECMARIRKYPAISYLVVSIFPLLPGAGVYRTTASILIGDMDGFVANATNTIAVAGSLAVGILIVSTIARMWSIHQQKHANTVSKTNKNRSN